MPRVTPPEIAVADLDPLSFDLWEPTEQNNARLYFHLGKPDADAMCPRLPDGTSVTLNGVKANVDSLGGATSTKLADTNCKRADFLWREVPMAKEATSKIVVDDGKAKVECALAVGLPLRPITPSVTASGESTRLIVEASAPAVTFSAHQAQVGAEGELALLPIMPNDVRVEGNRLTMLVPAKSLPKSGNYRLVLDATLKTTALCTPERKTPSPSFVHVRSVLPLTVVRRAAVVSP